MNPLPNLIGLSGYAGAGKDTLAQLLAQRYGYRVMHFADLLRELCRKVNPIVGITEYGTTIRWWSLEDTFGYAIAKSHERYGDEFRGVMQRLGQGAREVFGECFWADVTMQQIDSDERVVIADCRYPNEAEAVKKCSGIVVRIDRPDVGPVNGHISETALDDWPFDAVVVNDQGSAAMLDRLGGVFILPGEIIHACPPGDSGIMPCCGATPFEVSTKDRIAIDSKLVTCGKAEANR